MFEDALVESIGRFRSTNKWTTPLSFALQAAILIAAVVFARIAPQTLATVPVDIALVPPTILPKPPVIPLTKLAQANSTAIALPLQTPGVLTKISASGASSDGPAPASSFKEMSGLVAATGAPATATASTPAVATAKSARIGGPTRISSGAIQANCISCPPPLYPATAKAVRVSGTVVLAALISTSGTIEHLQFVSGPPLLRNAAMDAARNWRYKPTVLGGQPVEVQTEINVVFHLD